MTPGFPLDLSVDAPEAKRKLDQYLALAREPAYPGILYLLRMYVGAAISAPSVTVGTKWGVTAMPGTLRKPTYQRLAAISLAGVETFVIFRVRADEVAPWLTHGFVNVDRHTLLTVNGVGDLAGLRQRYPDIVFDDAHYRGMEGTGLTVWFQVDPPPGEDEHALWDVDGSLAAARAMADRLFGRGAMHSRFTNPFLASSVIGTIE
jgi:hypothetical protein